jgi:tetratricopeptide (TPR) repeat protein
MSTRNAVGLAVLAVLGGALGYRLYSRGMGTLGAPPSQVATPFRTEEQWIVGEIVRDLEEMARFAKTGEPAKASGPGVPATMPSPAEGPWSPAGYESHAKALLQAQGVAARPAIPSSDVALLGVLTHPAAQTLARENLRLSEALRRDFTNPDRHEDAALLIGAFALREADSHFADTRASLSRMTAHLALARALRGSAERSLGGRYAEIVHAALAGRTAAALELIEGLPHDPSTSEAAWRATLTLRATQDWRGFADPSGRTLLEQLEYLRALVATERAEEAAAFLSEADAANQADWFRLTAPAQLGVELGNQTVLESLPAIVAEIGEVRAASLLPRVATGALATELRKTPGRCVGPAGPEALDWGTWAAFYSRAIVEHVARADMYLRRVQGVAGAADDYQKVMNRDWGALTLYPIATTHWTRRQEMNLDRIADAISVAIASPQLVTAHNWGRLAEAQGYEPVRRGMPPAAAWFAPAIPRGTAYDARHRLERLGHSPRRQPDLQALAAVDPHDFTIATSLARARHNGRPTVAQLRSVLGDRVEFDQRASELLSEAASTGDAGQREEVLAANCQRSVAACFDLAHHLVDEGREQEAADVFERAIGDPSVDRVLAASHSRWLIDYHFRQGHQDRALELANAAAETGSYPGLSFRARLLEQMERYADAESDFEAMAERYDNNSSLVAFHYRMARGRGQAAFEAKLKRSARALFPKGLEKVGDPGAKPPTDGAYVMDHSPELLKAGLRAGDVIVGVDGWRIRAAAQYEAVVRFDRADDMSFTIWRGGYQQVRATVKDRWLGVRLVDFPVKGWVAGKREVQG